MNPDDWAVLQGKSSNGFWTLRVPCEMRDSWNESATHFRVRYKGKWYRVWSENKHNTFIKVRGEHIEVYL